MIVVRGESGGRGGGEEISKKITSCPDAHLLDASFLSGGDSGNVFAAVPGVRARVKAKRKTYICKCCEKEYNPNSFQMKKGKGYCFACSGTVNIQKRKMVKKLGSYAAYEVFISLPGMNEAISQWSDSLIWKGYHFRVQYKLPVSANLQKQVDRLKREIEGKRYTFHEESFSDPLWVID